jgi:multiple sugar transport system ATP-binding protein
VAVGRAIVREPTVFLMDEPLSNLDAKLRVQMRTEITDLHRRLGITFVYVTHDQTEAMTMSTRVAVMLDGQMLQIGRPADLYVDPVDRRVAEFVGSPRINLIAGRSQHQGVAAAGVILPLDTALLPGTPVSVGIRPEAVGIGAAEAGSPAGRVALPARVRFVENLGADLFVHAVTDHSEEELIARATPQAFGHLAPGDAVTLTLAAEQALLFDSQGRRIRTATAADRRVRVH